MASFAKFAQFGGDIERQHDDYTIECCLDNSGALSGSNNVKLQYVLQFST